MALFIAAASSSALSLVIRENLLALGVGDARMTYDYVGALMTIRYLETGLGIGNENGYGGFVSWTLNDDYWGYYQSNRQFNQTVGAGMFWHSPPQPSLTSVAVYAGACRTIVSNPVMHRVSFGLTLTAVAVAPEVELFWMREYRPHGEG